MVGHSIDFVWLGNNPRLDRLSELPFILNHHIATHKLFFSEVNYANICGHELVDDPNPD